VSFPVPRIEAPFKAEITLPGSKSIALRQLTLAALAHGESIIHGIPPCDDTDAMLAALVALGLTVENRDGAVAVSGVMDRGQGRIEIDARMSGASTRLLIGLAALREGKTFIDGHPSLRARTNAPLLAVLEQYGCRIESRGGCLPLTIRGPFAPPPQFSIEGSLSSQYVTALLIAATAYAQANEQSIDIAGNLVSKPYIDITLNEMAKRGIEAGWACESQIRVRKAPVADGDFTVEGDATAATYFEALATLHGSEVTLTNLGAKTVQGDYGFCDIMAELGAEVTKGTTTTIRGPEHLASLPSLDLTGMPDAALTLIAMAPLLPATTTLHGLGSLHHKECDRLECPAAELRAMGVDVETGEESIVIQPADAGDIRPHTLNTYDDHRMAMAFSVLGSMCEGLAIDDKTVVNKTYPAYWDDYGRLVG
jgi:3-phosphoshikimate 1-carboxyvinyltransferase